MMHSSLDKTFDAKEAALERLDQSTRNLNAVQTGFRPRDGGWSIKEILEHLVLVERSLLQLIPSLLGKAEQGQGAEPSSVPYEVVVEPLLERSKREKYRTRDRYEPSGTIDVLESMKALRDLDAELRSLRSRLASVNPSLVRFNHWIFGPLDLGQWVAFAGLHEERHLAQIEAIIAAPGFQELS